jgi:hypothetical protein
MTMDDLRSIAIDLINCGVEMVISNGGDIWDDYDDYNHADIADTMRDIVDEIKRFKVCESCGNRLESDDATYSHSLTGRYFCSRQCGVELGLLVDAYSDKLVGE